MKNNQNIFLNMNMKILHTPFLSNSKKKIIRKYSFRVFKQKLIFDSLFIFILKNNYFQIIKFKLQYNFKLILRRTLL